MVYQKELRQIILFFCLIIFISCNTTRNINEKDNCFNLVTKLGIGNKDQMTSWLDLNTIECSKILDFINEANGDFIARRDYCVEMIQIKMLDEGFKIERLIEF